MPDYNIIDRTGAAVLIPEERSKEILAAIPEQSIAMRLMRRLPDMSSKTRTMPVASSLPDANFINGDTGLKPTTNMTWDNVILTAEEIATIVPIPQNVLDDSDYDIWANVMPRIVEAIGATFDKAVLFGTNKPSSFPAGIVPGAITAGNAVALSNTSGLYQQLLGENGMTALVEEDGFTPNGYVGAIAMRSKLRGTVDANGLPIFGRAPYRDGLSGKAAFELDGADIYFPNSDVLDASEALLIGGDWTQAVWAIRTDITTKLLTEAVISDASGKVLLNLAQQDCVGLRVVFRAGWALPNPVNRVNKTKATRYPFSALLPSTVDTIKSARYNVTAPAKNGTPQSTHDSGTGYTATIAWSPVPSTTFAAETVYTATVVLTAADGYVFAADFDARDIVGLPATTGDGHPAQTVTVTHTGNTCTIAVKYVATAA